MTLLRVTHKFHTTMVLTISRETSQVVPQFTLESMEVVSKATDMAWIMTIIIFMELLATQPVILSDMVQVVMDMVPLMVKDSTATDMEMVVTFRKTSTESLETSPMTITQLMNTMRPHLTLHPPPSVLIVSLSLVHSLTPTMDSTTLTLVLNTMVINFTEMIPTTDTILPSLNQLPKLPHFPITLLMNAMTVLIPTQIPTVLPILHTLTTLMVFTPTIDISITRETTTILLMV